MDIEQQLRAVLVPRRPGPAVRAVVMARVSATCGARRNPRRPIYLFTVLAIAAAAAVLVAYQSGSWQQVVNASPTVQPVAAVGQLQDQAVVPAQSSQAIPAQVATKPDAIPQADSPTGAPVAGASRVLLLRSLRIESDNPEVRQALREFHDAFIGSLRNVPGLVVLQVGMAGGSSQPDADYRLTLVGGADDGKVRLDAVIDEQGEVTLQSRRESAARPVAAWQMVMLLEVPRSAAGDRFSATIGGPARAMAPAAMGIIMEHHRQKKGSHVVTHLGELSGPLSSSCGDSAVRRSEYCGRTPALQGAIIAEQMRTRIFPVDQQLTSNLQAKVLDSGRPYRERFDALGLLARSNDDRAMNLAIVRAALELAATAPHEGLRGRVLDLLRGHGQPGLLPALIDMAGRGPDMDTRLRALSLLIADYGEDVAARKALEALAASDPQPLVRQVALRSLSGEEQWKAYVAANLRNESLTPAARFSPLAYLVQTNQKQDARKLLDDAVISALVDVVPALINEQKARMDALEVLALLPAENSPVVIDLLLASMDAARDAGFGELLLSALARRHEDPRVRIKLEKIATDDADQSMRDRAAMVLKGREKGQ